MIFFIDDESSGYKAPNISIAMIDISGVFFHVLGAMADLRSGRGACRFFLSNEGECPTSCFGRFLGYGNDAMSAPVQ